MMTLIDRTEIELWGKTHPAKGDFPKLLAKLIRESTPQSTSLRMPSGSGVYIEGYDGVVVCENETGYVPKGTSFWEIGTNSGVEKADRDYKKRTFEDDSERSKSTFVFVTTNLWKDKDKWVEQKLKDGVWANIKVYDSIDIVEWLENCPVSIRWFSTLTKSYPHDNIFTAEENWQMLSVGPKGELPPTIVTGGRDSEKERLLKFLTDSPGVLGVKGFTKDEAIAFVIASIMQFEEPVKEHLLSRCLIVNKEESFQAIRINRNSLVIVANIEDPSQTYVAVKNGHHIIIPLKPDDVFKTTDVISLPRISRDSQIATLIEIGLEREHAIRLSKESCRDYTFLKKLLKFPLPSSSWAKTYDIRELVPVFLIGRWDGTNIKDKAILEALCGEDYDNYLDKLYKWLSVESPPLIKIGESWRLTSPLEIWTIISNVLTKRDFERLGRSFLKALREIKPAFRSATFGGYENSSYSGWCREGLVQALILIGKFGNELKFQGDDLIQIKIDSLIKELLLDAPEVLWASCNKEMPLIAEASPRGFIDSVFHALKSDENPILRLFQEDSFFPYTGLLWALEGLAWSPNYFSQSALLLAKLSSIDPGGRLINSPQNSLKEIFRPWHYQTFASLNDRMIVLDRVMKEELEIGWDILNELLSITSTQIAHPTYKMRWRLFEKDSYGQYSLQELQEAYPQMINKLMLYFDFSEKKLADLVRLSTKISPPQRKEILTFIQQNWKGVTNNKNLGWHALREILALHKSVPKAKWALKGEELEPYETLYSLLTPLDLIERTIWMFEKYWPSFPEGFDEEDMLKPEKQQIIEKKRIEGVNLIYQNLGLEKIKSLVEQIGEPFIFGRSLAQVITDEGEIISLCNLLKGDKKALTCILGFFQSKSIINGVDWIFEIYEQLNKLDFNSDQLASLFLPVRPDLKVWKFIDEIDEEINRSYWGYLNPIFGHLPVNERIFGIKKLMAVERFTAALVQCFHDINEYRSSLIIEILLSAANQDSNAIQQLDAWKIKQIIENLEEREDIERSELLKVEWLYFSFMNSYPHKKKTSLFHEEMLKNANFFCEIFSWAHKTPEAENSNARPENQSSIKSMNAFNILNAFNQIPGVDQDGKIDEKFLSSWISEVRDYSIELNKLYFADSIIGRILAFYPENMDEWPPIEICRIIETINTTALKSAFSAATFNKRGFSSRDVFDGGDIEKGHAGYFMTKAERIKTQFPHTADIFYKLAEEYRKDATSMDERAEKDSLDY